MTEQITGESPNLVSGLDICQSGKLSGTQLGSHVHRVDSDIGVAGSALDLYKRTRIPSPKSVSEEVRVLLDAAS